MWRRAAALPKCSCSASTAKEDNSRVSSAINKSYHTPHNISLDESAIMAIYYKCRVRGEYVGYGLYRNCGGFLYHGGFCAANREAAKAGRRRSVLLHVISLFNRSAALARLRRSGPRSRCGVGERPGRSAGVGIDRVE